MSSGGVIRCRAAESFSRGSAPSGKVSVSGARRGPVNGTVRSSGSRQLSPSRMPNSAVCTWARRQRGPGAGRSAGPVVRMSVPVALGASVIRSTRTR